MESFVDGLHEALVVLLCLAGMAIFGAVVVTSLTRRYGAAQEPEDEEPNLDVSRNGTPPRPPRTYNE